MKIIWDIEKQIKLKRDRNIDLDEIKALLEQNLYVDILEHPSKPNQFFLPLQYNGYIHIVVVKIELSGTLIIKTCYPSRKANKKYSRLPK